MPGGISLGDLAKDTATVTIVWGDVGDCDVVYRPSRFTAEAEQKMLKAAKAEAAGSFAEMEGSRPYIDLIVQLVVDWDLYVDDAKTEKVAVDPDTVSKLPLQFIVAVFDQIGSHMRGKVEAGAKKTLPR